MARPVRGGHRNSAQVNPAQMNIKFKLRQFGDPNTFCIHCGITDLFDSISMRAYGCFYYSIGGCTYGVTRHEATTLVLSYDQVVERLQWRGQNRYALLADADLATVLDMHHTCFWPGGPADHWHGLPIDLVVRQVVASGIILAPDGDAAFDDSSCVYMFDRADGDVELFAFKKQCESDPFSDQRSLRLPNETFYDTLEAFATWFEQQTGLVRPKPAPSRRIHW